MAGWWVRGGVHDALRVLVMSVGGIEVIGRCALKVLGQFEVSYIPLSITSHNHPGHLSGFVDISLDGCFASASAAANLTCPTGVSQVNFLLFSH